MYSDNMTLDELVDVLENVVNTNVEIEQKQALLRQKVEELKKMFENKPLDELKSLKFSSEMDVILDVPKQEPKQETKPKNVTTEKVS